jgi:predicted ATP-dependent endonuclease of OLD family
VKAVVIVEGESDRIAVETLAARRGRDLVAEGVAVVAIGGAQALERALRTLDAERIAGLYDRGEEAAVLGARSRERDAPRLQRMRP